MKDLKNMKMTLCLIIIVSIITTIKAQEVNYEQGKDDIIKKCWNAMFGKYNINDIQSIYVECYYSNRSVPSKMTINRPNLFRNETESGVLVFDGSCSAWVDRSPDKNGNPRYPELLSIEHWKHFEIDIALIFPAFFEYECELKGATNFNGMNVYELFVELPLGGKITYFIDCMDFLIKGRLVNWSGDIDAPQLENTIYEYQNYAGVNFPEFYLYPAQNEDKKVIYKNFKININPADELFKIPRHLK